MALKRIGALWKKKDKKGKDYFSGTIELGALGEIRVMVFENEPKQEQNHPDWTIHLATDEKEERKPVAEAKAKAKK
jgi:hypothetical protein